MTVRIVFRTIAGNTTVENRTKNGAGKLTIIRAEPRKTTPLTTVPMTDKIPALTTEFLIFCKRTTSAKQMNAVINLSIIFGIKPPGNVEIKPDKKPVNNPMSKTCFVSGNNNIAMNIITNRTSGRIPKFVIDKINDKTVPIPNSIAINTKFFVFNLNSPLLS